MEKAINALVWVLAIIASIVLACMMLLTVIDVGGRYLFNRPILGSTELTEFMMVPLCFFAIVWCTRKNLHIKLDLMTKYLPPVIWAVIDSIFYLLGIGLFSFITWQNYQKGMERLLERHTSDILIIPFYPFYFLVSFACGIVVLILLFFILQHIGQAIKKWK
jgi:TRAP-type C4-dicarboxylate transport system permease small subunit